MRIVYHLGSHCTDEDRLVRTLLRNRGMLAEQGIAVPPPTRYRKLLRDTAVQLRGASASPDTQAMVLEQLLDGESARRVVLSWDSFLSFPQWALRGQLYGFAGERIQAFTRIFPALEAEFHLAIRSPASFLPALFARQKGRSWAEFTEGSDIEDLRWSDVIRQILQQNPGVPLTVWSDEDTPLIWPEVLNAVAGQTPATPLVDEDELLSQLMSADGLARLRGYLESHPPANVAQRRRATTAFLEKFGRADQLRHQISLPGWDQALIDRIEARHREDLARIAAMPGLRLIAA